MQLLSACTLVTRRIDFSSGRVNGVYHACEGFIKNYCRKNVFYATIYRRRKRKREKKKGRKEEKDRKTRGSSRLRSEIFGEFIDEGSRLVARLTDRSISDLTIANPFKSVPLRFECRHRSASVQRWVTPSRARFFRTFLRGTMPRWSSINDRFRPRRAFAQDSAHSVARRPFPERYDALLVLIANNRLIVFFPFFFFFLSSIIYFYIYIITTIQQRLFFFLSIGPRIHRKLSSPPVHR